MTKYKTAPRTCKELKLRAIRLLKQGWTKGTSARNARGEPISLYGDDVTSVCALGAIARASGGHGIALRTRVWEGIRQYLASIGHYNSFVEYNDYTAKSVDDVIDILRKAKPGR